MSQLKVFLGLKLFHDSEGKVKLCVIHPGMDLIMISRSESRALEELNFKQHLLMQLPGYNEEEYTKYAAEANMICKRIWHLRADGLRIH